MPFRLIVTTLCVWCAVMLALPPPVVVVQSAQMKPSADEQPLNVIDVAAGVAPATLVPMLRLAADERVRAIGERLIDEEVDDLGALFAAMAPGSGGYLDLTIKGAERERRIVVLRH